MLLSFKMHSKFVCFSCVLKHLKLKFLFQFCFVNGSVTYENDIFVATSLNAFSFSL